MPLGKGIVAMVSAVQERIEVSGQSPTWRVTAGTYDAAVAYAREAWEDPAVLARETHGRWWPRVTVTVTVDRTLAATAPSPEELEKAAARLVPRQRRSQEALVADILPPSEEDLAFEPGLLVSLEQIFAHQEAVRLRDGGVIPRQRAGAEGP